MWADINIVQRQWFRKVSKEAASVKTKYNRKQRRSHSHVKQG